jgi:hypothetical protein
MIDDEFVVIYVDRKHGNAYYDRYRNNWIKCAVEHEEGRALHLDRKSGALVCYGYGHENNYIGGRTYRIVEIDVDAPLFLSRCNALPSSCSTAHFIQLFLYLS